MKVPLIPSSLTYKSDKDAYNMFFSAKIRDGVEIPSKWRWLRAQDILTHVISRLFQTSKFWRKNLSFLVIVRRSKSLLWLQPLISVISWRQSALWTLASLAYHDHWRIDRPVIRRAKPRPGNGQRWAPSKAKVSCCCCLRCQRGTARRPSCPLYEVLRSNNGVR